MPALWKKYLAIPLAAALALCALGGCGDPDPSVLLGPWDNSTAQVSMVFYEGGAVQVRSAYGLTDSTYEMDGRSVCIYDDGQLSSEGTLYGRDLLHLHSYGGFFLPVDQASYGPQPDQQDGG